MLDAIVGGLKELSAEVRGLQRGMGAVEERLAGVEGRLTGVEAELRELRTDVADRLDKIENDIHFLETEYLEQKKELLRLARRKP